MLAENPEITDHIREQSENKANNGRNNLLHLQYKDTLLHSTILVYYTRKNTVTVKKAVKFMLACRKSRNN
jgi:hypothetical protein